MAELKKYRVVTESYTNDSSFFEEKINALAEVGYRVSQLATVRPLEGWTDGEYIALMSLHSNKFEGITNLKEVHPSEVDEYLLQGWEILDTYSKTIRLVRRTK